MPIPIVYIIPKTRKGLKILMSILLFISIALTLFAYFSWLTDQKVLNENGQPSFNTLNRDELKDGLIVKGTIDLAFDSYAEAYETNLGIRSSDKSEALYYLVPIYEKNNDGTIKINYIITYRAEENDFEALDKICKQTWSDTEKPTPFAVKNANIVNMPNDIKQYLSDWAKDPKFYEGGSFIDWCVENNIFQTNDRAVIETKLVPFLIVRTSTAGTDPSAIWGLLALTVIILVVLLLLIFYKHPIKGIEDPPNKDDFDKVRNFSEKQ